MRVYHFTEQPYPAAWRPEFTSLRVNLPNRLCEPELAAAQLHRYEDEWQLADELGFDIMLNEHHSTATCMSASAAVTLSILARQTQRARLLVLGMPIANRPDPLRVAEELAMVDVISRGRLEIGLVKGVPYEVPVANLNPVRMMDRFWEAHDFLIKAMTSHDGPFSWEGEYFHYRNVNIWPRPYQQPHPPIWITATSKTNVPRIAELGYVMATMATGYNVAELFRFYREVLRGKGRPEPSLDRFAYLGLVAIATTEEEARRRGEQIAGYLRTSAVVAEPFRNPPGFLSAEVNAQLLRRGGKGGPRAVTRDGRPIDLHNPSVQDLIDAGVMFAGTPDQVYRQITDFNEAVGGFGSLLMMGQAGWLSHSDTVDSLTLFAKEVLPRLKEWQPRATATVAA